MGSWEKKENYSIFSGEKMKAVILVPDIKTMVKWTLVLIYGRFYINDYSQGKILFESQMIMVFNEVLGEIFTYSYFSGQ